jgi:hypothetical protein
MSIVMTHDPDNGIRCFVYSEKNIYIVNMTKSQHSVFYSALPQLLYVHTCT